jgi:PAS domain S-box-containing protein
MNLDLTKASKGSQRAQLRAALLESQRRVLERIASGAQLEEILGTLVRLIEEQDDQMRCAVLLADAAQEQLHFVAAPRVPQDYRLCMVPFLKIAPEMGSCGTAAYLRKPVYTSDTASDPLWKNCREIAVRNGFRAIWSTPIVSDDNRVLGTFAMYYGEPGLPAEEHIQLIDMATQMARVAIEAKFDDTVLRTVFDDAQKAMLVSDVAGTIVAANLRFAKLLGYRPGDLRGKEMAQITEGANYAALFEELVAGNEDVLTDRCYRTASGELLWARERSSLRRNASGEPRFVFSHVIEAPAYPLAERLSRREREVFELVVGGCTSKAIAARLGISPTSVDTYRSRIMVKLEIDNLPGLVRFAIRHGFAR